MRRTLLAAWLLAVAASATAQNILVVDEDGKPVDRFEAMYHTANEGYGVWEVGVAGRWNLEPYESRRADVVDVIVRCDGFATSFKRLNRAEIEALGQTPTTITLTKGREVTLAIRPPAGMQVPADFLPEVYPQELAWRVRIMWQPSNQRAGKSDFNFFNVKPAAAAGEYSFRMPADAGEFFVACQQPGWLRFFETGPFGSGDFQNDSLTVDLPRPASIDVRFDVGDRSAEELPFEKVYFDIMWSIPASEGSYLSVTEHGAQLTDGGDRVTDLSPGAYMVMLSTQPKEAPAADADPLAIQPGRFRAAETVEALAGQVAEPVFAYVPFDADAWKGTGRARVRVLLSNGEPAAGKAVSVQWYDGHYGNLSVFEGAASADGVVDVEGLSTIVSANVPFGPYSVSLEGERVGFFRLQPTSDVQEFEFRVAPKPGDEAPSFPLVNIQTGEPLQLADFRGKIVLVEFWATWCGPCQPAMSKLKEVGAAHEAEWEDTVVVVPLSTDKTIKRAAAHLASRGWDAMPQYWAARQGGEYFSQAEIAYGVQGIPHAVLIDQNGKVVWIGHPLGDDEGRGLVGRIEALRTPPR